MPRSPYFRPDSGPTDHSGPHFAPASGDGRLAGANAANGANRSAGAAPRPPWLGDGYSRLSGDGYDEAPQWSGDGRSSYINPLMPMFASADSQGDGRGRYSGDGRRSSVESADSGAGSSGVAVSDDLVMRVNTDGPRTAAAEPRETHRERSSSKSDGKTMKSTPSETWKLVCLVVVFLLWISTASTLLFLYMDRYLFPG